jgi:MFS family permease
VTTNALPAGSPDEPGPTAENASALEVFRNRPFLLLWLSQAATQIGGNMVIYGLTVIVLEATSSNTAVSVLILTFLAPAVLFSALAGVYVDRIDRRLILVATNVFRAVAYILTYLAGGNLLALFVLNALVSSMTVFFSPAEAAMIPTLVARRLLIAANGIFIFTLQASFAVGFALLGPIVVRVAGAPTLILLVAGLYLVAAAFCWALPSSPPPKRDRTGMDPRSAVANAEEAVGSTIAQLREGLQFVRANPRIGWSLIYMGTAFSLVGVLGVLGPGFATTSLGLSTQDFVVVVLPLGMGLVTGVLILNSYGRLLPRRRVIETALVALGILLAMLSVSGPLSRFIRQAEDAVGLADLGALTSLLAIVVLIGYLAGIAFAFVAVPSQTQLQEDIPAEGRGRVFGILNMLVSVAAFLPIIVVGPVSDMIGTTVVMLLVGCGVVVVGVTSIVRRGPLRPEESAARAGAGAGAPVDPMGVAIAAELTPEGTPRHPGEAPVADHFGLPFGINVDEVEPESLPGLEEAGDRDGDPPIAEDREADADADSPRPGR